MGDPHTRPENPRAPNEMAATTDTVPLLATVLAGFATTAVVELLLSPEAQPSSTSEEAISCSQAALANCWFHAALAAFAVSIPLLLAAAVCAARGMRG